MTKDLGTKVQTSNLNEQLGQVDYVFSDKTGTLTCNLMEFKKMSIGTFSYGIDTRKAKNCNPTYTAKCRDAADKQVTNFNFEDEAFFEHFQNTSHPNHQTIVDFLTHLGVCHTVVAEAKHDGTTSYNASSPDELALVNAAKYFGYFFKGRDDDNNIEVEILGKSIRF